MCNEYQMSQIFIIHNVKFYLIRIVYKTWHDLLHHFSGEPVSTSSLTLINVQTNDKKSSYIMGVRTFLNLLMEMVCWLHVLFVLIFMIYLFTSSQQSQQQHSKSPPVFIYLCKSLVDYMCFSFYYSWSICLLLQSEVNNSIPNHHLFLFTYANKLLITCVFPFNIHDLFVYFFTAKSTTASQITTCFYLLMEIAC